MRLRGQITSGQSIIIIIVVSAIVAITFGVYKKWWPWLMRNVSTAQYQATSWGEMLLFDIILENLWRVYYPHSLKLLSYEKANIAFDSIDLRELTALPGVTDAFRMDFQRRIAATERGTLDADTLIAMFSRPKRPGVKRGGTAQMMRRTVGGLTRFEQHKSGDRFYPMLIRFIGTYYPDRATQAVGVILDREWFVRQVPALMDSLARENNAMLFMAPQPPDTQWLPVSDPYRAANNNWKQTMGILDGKDTLWWYGDPNVRIHEGKIQPGEDPGYFVELDPFGLSVLVNVEFPESSREIIAGRRTVKWLLPMMQIMTQAILIILVAMVVAYIAQSRRNRLALSHLAHSVKTPVARLKLNTDTLIEGRVASEDEELQGIKAVSDEVARLELAVRNAALSLEKGRLKLNLKECSLAEIALDCARAWQLTFEKAGFPLKVEHAGSPLTGKFDRGLIAVMIDNLIDNGLHYTRLNLKNLPRNTATVTLHLKYQDGKGLLMVDDTGRGVPESERRRIFKRYYRGKDYALTSVSGLGLGLSLVKDIVEAHRGRVWVESNRAGGARFVVEFPVMD